MSDRAIAAIAAAASVGALWCVARAAGRRRGLDLGPTPYVALAAVALAAFAAAQMRPGWASLALTLSLAGTGIAALTDARTGYIFDDCSLLAGAATLAAAVAANALVGAATGILACAGTLLTLFLATRGRGLGFGDVKLAAVIGCGLGAPAGLVALGAAFVVGGITGVVLLARGAARQTEIRFGPYLALGASCAPWLSGYVWR